MENLSQISNQIELNQMGVSEKGRATIAGWVISWKMPSING
jgi:hypothetical protein